MCGDDSAVPTGREFFVTHMQAVNDLPKVNRRSATKKHRNQVQAVNDLPKVNRRSATKKHRNQVQAVNDLLKAIRRSATKATSADIASRFSSR
jgi:hypothetical protein